MLLKYMTTNEFVASVKALGLRTRANKTYGVNFIDIQDANGDTIAFVDVDIQGKMSVRRVTECYDHNTLFQVMCAYASTPVSERESNMYKLKILDTNLYRVMELIESIDADTVEELKDKLMDEIGRLS